MRKILLILIVAAALAILGVAPFTQQLGIMTIQSNNAEALTATNLNLNIVTKNIQWSYYVTVAGKLSNAGTGAGIGGKVLTFDGTGGSKMTKVITNPDGSFVAGGISPNSVANGWAIKAHFAGDATFGGSNSNEVTYNTIKHTAKLNMQLSPMLVNPGDTYGVSGSLKDGLTNRPLASETISFTAENPIVIEDVASDSAGAYAVSGLIAPLTTTAEIYDIQAHFAGNSLYSAADSQTNKLSVLGPDNYEPNDDTLHAYFLSTIPQDVGPLEFTSNMHSPTDEDWFTMDALEKAQLDLDDIEVQITLTNIPAGSNYDLYVSCPNLDCNPSSSVSSTNPGNLDESIMVSTPDFAAITEDLLLVIEVRNISDTASASPYTLTITVT
jgi:hypothetical protein